MAQPTNAALERELGQLQGEMLSVKDSLDRIEGMVKTGFDKMEQRLRALEDKENQRKGAFALAMLLCGAIGAVLTKLLAGFGG